MRMVNSSLAVFACSMGLVLICVSCVGLKGRVAESEGLFVEERVVDVMPKWSKPVRIPEGVNLTHAEPPFALSDHRGSWRLPFELSRNVAKDADLNLQIWGGRNNKGAFLGPQVDSPKGDGYLSARLDEGTPLVLEKTNAAGTFRIGVPEGGLKKGQTLTVVLGDTSAGGGGISVCEAHYYNKFFVLYDDFLPTGVEKSKAWARMSGWGEGNQVRMVAACSMHILGAEIDHLRAYAPSVVKPGEKFSVLIRPEDGFSNLSCQRLEKVVLSLDGVELDAKVEAVKESTCIRLVTSLPREGVFRLTVREPETEREAVTNPIVCSVDQEPVYWGMIHGHTELSDGTGTLDSYFNQLRNEVGLDFAASADHDHLWETPDEYWEQTCEVVKDWNQPGQFVAFLGYEWAKWRRNGAGDRNVYYLKDDRPLYRSEDGRYPLTTDMHQVLKENREEAIVIPHHPAHGGNFVDWKDYSPERERLVEIFQNRGGYECSPEDGNPVPEKESKVAPFDQGYVRNALTMGCRIGFTAGGDDHMGQWGTEFLFGQYKQGLFAVEGGEKSRESLFGGMYARRTVATTGKRMLLSYRLNGQSFGSELRVRDMPELRDTREVKIEAHGMAPIQQIDIIRNGSVVHTIPGEGRMDIAAVWTDREKIDETWLPAALHCDHPFTYYYVRMIQQDNEVAWASPIWVDP